MQVYIARDRSNFAAESGNLVGQHAGSRNLDRIVPIVVVVAQCVGEVQDGHLTDVGRIFSHVEMGRLNTALGHAVGHQEEVELAIHHLALLHEALVDVSTLRRVVDESLAGAGLGLLEESLANALINDNKRDLRALHVSGVHTLRSEYVILFGDDLVELF